MIKSLKIYGSCICSEYSENEILSDKSGKITAGPIKTLGFQNRLSGIVLSFNFANFVKIKKNKKLFEIFPQVHVSFPVTSEKFCYFIGHLRVYAWGMGDNTIFSVFSNIWSSVCLKIPPQFQASCNWWQRLFTLDMAS